MKYIIPIIVIILVIVLGGLGYAYFTDSETERTSDMPMATTTPIENDAPDLDGNATSTDGGENENEEERQAVEVIGTSVENRDITAYRYGDGDTELLFVGGIHGGYSWNTPLVARNLMNYLENNPSAIPENLTVTVIPVLNPDGLFEVTGTTGTYSQNDIPQNASEVVAGRFNANDVDLNRNFACDWQSTGVWQDRQVDAGSSAFSEPEARVLRDYVQNNDPRAVVVWYSASGDVVASSCDGQELSETQDLVNAFAGASGYNAREEFDYYEITGDATNWMASIGVPSISVVLETRTSPEWQQNQAGIEAIFDYYAE